MKPKKIIVTLLMLFSITISSAQAKASETPMLNELANDLVIKVKMAKEYFMTSSDAAAGTSFDERSEKLSIKVRALFFDYKVRMENQDFKNALLKSNDPNNFFIELTEVRRRLQYLYLPIDL